MDAIWTQQVKQEHASGNHRGLAARTLGTLGGVATESNAERNLRIKRCAMDLPWISRVLPGQRPYSVPIESRLVTPKSMVITTDSDLTVRCNSKHRSRKRVREDDASR
jgi:hypothetical protein